MRNSNGKTAMANAFKGLTPYSGLASADPGTTGSATNELSGGSPAYARKASGWGTAASGAVSGSASFDVPASATVAYYLGCTSSTAGTADVIESSALTSQAFSSQGTYTVTPSYTQN